MKIHSSQHIGRTGHRGFTLVELLLVLAVIGIMVAVTAPRLARSMRGNRIRVATRAVVTAGRYARNISILRENQHALLINLDAGTVSVSVATKQTATNTVAEVDGFDDLVEDDNNESNIVFAAQQAFQGTGEFERSLDGVKIVSVEMRDGETLHDGTAVIVFESNGRCQAYVVTLEDELGKKVVIDVDPLACAETEEVL